MLYAVVDGPGEILPAEARESIKALYDSPCEHEDESNWFLVVLAGAPSPAMVEIIKEIDRVGAWFATVHPEGLELDQALFKECSEYYPARRPFPRAFELVQSMPTVGEPARLVALLGDEECPDDLAFIIEECFGVGIPVLDMASQMMEIQSEISEENIVIPEEEEAFHEIAMKFETHTAVEPEREIEAPESQAEFLVTVGALQREELEKLGRSELRSLVDQYQVIPTDYRSKQSMIEALLKADHPAILTDETPVDEVPTVVDLGEQGVAVAASAQSAPDPYKAARVAKGASWSASPERAAQANEGASATPVVHIDENSVTIHTRALKGLGISIVVDADGGVHVQGLS